MNYFTYICCAISVIDNSDKVNELGREGKYICFLIGLDKRKWFNGTATERDHVSYGTATERDHVTVPLQTYIKRFMAFFVL